MKRVLASILLLLCLSALSANLVGCTSPAERAFISADVQVLGVYLQKAQPAIEAYCAAVGASSSADSAAATNAATLRAETRALAMELAANAKARLQKLSTEDQAKTAAQQALTIAASVIDSLEASSKTPTTAPAAQ